MEIPKLITFPSILQFPGKSITVNESKQFHELTIKRFYWINYTAADVTYSEHAHKSLQQIIIAVSGEVHITLESSTGEKSEFTLKEPNEGLFIPPMYWKKITYKNPCILLCLASEEFDENDYIRNYEEFKHFQL